MKSFIANSLLFGLAVGSPLQPRQASATSSASHSHETPAYWSHSGEISFPIHESCNASQTIALEKVFADLVTLAEHAKAHLLRYGNESEHVQKYFGNGTTSTPIGWYERILSADRGEMLFRCDDPDQNCATQSGKFWPQRTQECNTDQS